MSNPNEIITNTYKSITITNKIDLSAHGISSSMDEISALYPDYDLLLAASAIGPESVIVINNPEFVNQVLSPERKNEGEIIRGDSQHIIVNTGLKNALTALDGQPHHQARIAVEPKYFTNREVLKLEDSFSELMINELNGLENGEINSEVINKLSLKIMMLTMGENPHNSEAIEALESIYKLGRQRLQFEISRYIPRSIQIAVVNGARKIQSMVTKSEFEEWRPGVGKDMDVAVENFLRALDNGYGNRNSFFATFEGTPEAKKDWIISLALGTNSLQPMLARTIYEAFNGDEFEDQIAKEESSNGRPHKKLMELIVDKDGVPVKYISRLNVKDKPLTKKGRRIVGENSNSITIPDVPLKDQDGKDLILKANTRVFYNIKGVYEKTKNPALIFGAGEETICIARHLVPVALYNIYKTCRNLKASKEIKVLKGNYFSEYEQFAPLLTVGTDFSFTIGSTIES